MAIAIGEQDGSGPNSLARWWTAAEGNPTAAAAASYLAGVYLALDLPLPEGFLDRLPAQAGTADTAPMPPAALWFRMRYLAEDLAAPADGPPAHSSALSAATAQGVPVPEATTRLGRSLDAAGVSVAGTGTSAATMVDRAGAPTPLPSDVEGRRRAEAVALVLIAFDDLGPAGVHPATLHAALRLLRAVGLHGAARAIALEAVLGHGL